MFIFRHVAYFMLILFFSTILGSVLIDLLAIYYNLEMTDSELHSAGNFVGQLGVQGGVLLGGGPGQIEDDIIKDEVWNTIEDYAEGTYGSYAEGPAEISGGKEWDDYIEVMYDSGGVFEEKVGIRGEIIEHDGEKGVRVKVYRRLIPVITSFVPGDVEWEEDFRFHVYREGDFRIYGW